MHGSLLKQAVGFCKMRADNHAQYAAFAYSNVQLGSAPLSAPSDPERALSRFAERLNALLVEGAFLDLVRDSKRRAQHKLLEAVSEYYHPGSLPAAPSSMAADASAQASALPAAELEPLYGHDGMFRVRATSTHVPRGPAHVAS